MYARDLVGIACGLSNFSDALRRGSRSQHLALSPSRVKAAGSETVDGSPWWGRRPRGSAAPVLMFRGCGSRWPARKRKVAHGVTWTLCEPNSALGTPLPPPHPIPSRDGIHSSRGLRSHLGTPEMQCVAVDKGRLTCPRAEWDSRVGDNNLSTTRVLADHDCSLGRQ